MLVVLAPGVPRLASTMEPGRGLPPGGPAALYAPEPPPEIPQGWSFPEAFPRTSGTVRLAGGAAYWSGFLYDDHGARGVPVQTPVVPSSPPTGTFVYPPGPAHDNGADIAAAAVGLMDTHARFRVDWQTLADVNVPIAMWGFDTDDDPTTGGTTWPAGAGVRSPGIDRWLVVSGRGAWLLDPSGTRIPVTSVGGERTVDARARSFVVRLPTTALPGSGQWMVRLVAGLATTTGDTFAPVPRERGSLPGQPPVYDVGFRTHDQEPVSGDNWWRERAQAEALAAGDIRTFALSIDWAELADGATTEEPRPEGWTNGWYRSSIEAGHGVAPQSEAGDFRPTFLGRRQPFGLYLPPSAPVGQPAPVTILLHSINVQHNQFAIWNPEFIEGVCGTRGSVCLAPLGRGPDGWWAGEAELDMWETWNRVATQHRLDPTRSVLAGYSMGGYGVYRLGLEHPDAFAAAVVLAGAPACSIRIIEGVEQSVNPGMRECDDESDTSPLVENARELPFYIGHDALDELAPVPSAIEQAGRFDALGFRHRLEVYANQDHVAWALTGRFEGARQWLERKDRQTASDPARITYTWYAEHQRFDLGTGPGAVWWIGDLRARSAEPGFKARVDARSLALPERLPTIERTGPHAVVNGDGVASASDLRWGPSHADGAREPTIHLDLAGVASVTIDVGRGGLRPGEASIVRVTADATTTVQLTGLRPGTVVRASDGAVARVGPSGRISVEVGAGTITLSVAERGQRPT